MKIYRNGFVAELTESELRAAWTEYENVIKKQQNACDIDHIKQILSQLPEYVQYKDNQAFIDECICQINDARKFGCDADWIFDVGENGGFVTEILPDTIANLELND